MSTLISIITPCYNAEDYIEETAASVLGQKALATGRASLEYIVVDGQSQDRTVRHVEQTASNFTKGTVRIISEPDTGLYDAVAKGLKQATGNICAYLNAGDLYSPYAFDIVLDLFEKPSVRWLTGLNITYNHASQIVSCQFPFRYRRRLFECGLYNHRMLPMVQQESTFWHSNLTQMVDLHRLSQLKYAGDYFLWYQFSQHETLQIVSAYLGGFRVHHGQLSEDLDAYLQEMHTFTRSPNLIDRMIASLDKLLWYAPVKVKKRFNPTGLFLFDHTTQAWY